MDTRATIDNRQSLTKMQGPSTWKRTALHREIHMETPDLAMILATTSLASYARSRPLRCSVGLCPKPNHHTTQHKAYSRKWRLHRIGFGQSRSPLTAFYLIPRDPVRPRSVQICLLVPWLVSSPAQPFPFQRSQDPARASRQEEAWRSWPLSLEPFGNGDVGAWG